MRQKVRQSVRYRWGSGSTNRYQMASWRSSCQYQMPRRNESITNTNAPSTNHQTDRSGQRHVLRNFMESVYQ